MRIWNIGIYHQQYVPVPVTVYYGLSAGGEGGAFLEVIQLTECKLDMQCVMYEHISYMHLLTPFY
jgi:hypothetical protein